MSESEIQFWARGSKSGAQIPFSIGGEADLGIYRERRAAVQHGIQFALGYILLLP